MIPQISSGNNALGCLKYQEKDEYKTSLKTNGEEETNEKPLSRLIYTTNFIGTLGREPLNSAEINKGFKQWNLRNSAIKQNVFHASLNFPKNDDDKLHENNLIEIANNFMEQMGYEGIPYAIYQHFDTDHKHIHIVASRVDMDGKRVNDFQEMRRAIEIARTLEGNYGLWRVSASDQKKNLNREDQLKNLNALTDSISQKSYIRNQLKEALRVEKFESLQALQIHLKSKKIQMNINEKQGRTFLSFFVHTENEQSKIFFGSSIQKNLWSDISKKLNRNRKETLSGKHQKNIQAFRQELKSKLKIENLTELEGLLHKYGLTLQISRNYLKNLQGNQFVFKALENKEQLIGKLFRAEILHEQRKEEEKPFKTIHLTNYLKGLTEQKGYHVAKRGGDWVAAQRIVQSYFKNSQWVQWSNQKTVNVIPIQDHASMNQLPKALAQRIAIELNWQLNPQNIEIENKITFTNSSLWKRILFKPQIRGEVISNQKYFICDDVVTTGSTLKALINHIQRGGGEVIGVATLAARNTLELQQNINTIQSLESKFGKIPFEKFLKDYSIGTSIDDLTEIEMTYFLEHFKSVEELRERAKEQYQILARELLNTADRKIVQKLIKRDIKEDFNLDFEFRSINKSGKILYKDTFYQKTHRSLLGDELLKKCSFLLEDQDYRRQWTESQEIKQRLAWSMRKIAEWGTAIHSLGDFVDEMKSRGLQVQLNYHRRPSGDLEVQRLEVFIEDKRNALVIKGSEIFKSQKEFQGLFSSLDTALQRLEKERGREELKSTISYLNQVPIHPKEKIALLNFIESLTWDEFKEQTKSFSNAIPEEVFKHLTQARQNYFAMFKKAEQGTALSNHGFHRSLRNVLLASNSHYLTDFKSEVLEEKKFFDEK